MLSRSHEDTGHKRIPAEAGIRPGGGPDIGVEEMKHATNPEKGSHMTNSSALQVQVKQYLDAGWKLVPIPPRKKGPNHPGWNQLSSMLTQPALPEGWNVGLAHAFSGTCALDVDDWELAERYCASEGINLRALFEAPDAVHIYSGSKNRGKLLYKLPIAGMPMTTRQVKNPRDKRSVVMELRCAAQNGSTMQDVLPPSVHPEHGTVYTWGGPGDWRNLPVLPTELMDLWHRLSWQPSTTEQSPTAMSETGTWAEVREALTFLDPDMAYPDWIEVGMALHWLGHRKQEDDEAYETWDEWSSQGTKYKGERDLRSHWSSFTTEVGATITVGTLFKRALDAGWVRPPIDPTDLFRNVQTGGMQQVKDVIAMLRVTPPVPPLDLMPPEIRGVAEEVAESNGLDVIVPLFSAITTLCGAADARTRLEVKPGWKVPPVLWMMCVGDSAVRKTQGSALFKDTLLQLEQEDTEPYRQRIHEWRLLNKTAENMRKDAERYLTDPEAQLSNEKPPEAPPLVPPMPKKMKKLMEDATTAAIRDRLMVQPQGFLVHMDEMRHWMHQMTNKVSNEDRSAWVLGYEGGYRSVERTGAGDVSVENYAFSFYGNIQPRVLETMLSKMQDDGLLQRFVPAVLNKDKSRVADGIEEFMSIKPVYQALVRRLYGMKHGVYHTSVEARRVFRAFEEWHLQLQKDESDLGSPTLITGSIGKMTGFVGRLALVLHMVENPDSPEVSGQTMERAVRFAREFAIPSIHYTYHEHGGLSSVSLDKWVAEYIRQCSGERKTITLSELRRASRRYWDKRQDPEPLWRQNELLIDVMTWLAGEKWVHLMSDDIRGDRAEWAISPVPGQQFADERERMAKLRRERALFKGGPMVD